jgi:hypothetical protein
MTQMPAITFATFSYESSGFASFATKRRIRISLGLCC